MPGPTANESNALKSIFFNALNKDEFPFWLDCIVPFKTISGATCQIDSATIPGRTAEIKPAPLDMAPFNAKYAAPGYFSLPAISNVLPL